MKSQKQLDMTQARKSEAQTPRKAGTGTLKSASQPPFLLKTRENREKRVQARWKAASQSPFFAQIETKLCIVYSLIIMSVLLFGHTAAAAPDEPPGHFSIHTYDIFSPGDAVILNVSAYKVGSLELRIYRLTDPEGFFKSQRRFESPNPHRAKSITTADELMDEFSRTARTRYRNMFQKITTKETRETAVKTFGIDLDGPPVRRDREIPLLKENEGYKFLKKITHKIEYGTEEKSEWHYEDVELPIKARGAYLIEAVGADQVAYTVALVTGLRFVDKSTPTSKMLYVVDGMSGRPESGAAATFLTGKPQDAVTRTTGDDGVATFTHKRDEDVRFFVRKGDDFIAGDNYYWDYYMDRYKVYVYTDRPIYRPGHEVHFKAVMREVVDDGFTPVAGQEVLVTVLDSDYEEVLTQRIKSNDMGSVEGAFTVGKAATLGRWSIEISFLDNSFFGDFKVEEYRKPEYKVTVTPDKSYYIAGDTIEADVQAVYYFGEPVDHAQVEYNIYRSQYWVPWWAEDDPGWYQYGWFYADSDEYETYETKLVDKGEVELDAEGRGHITVPIKELEFDAVYTIVALVTDKNRHQVEGEKMVRVSRGEYVIRASTGRYGYPKDAEINLKVTTETMGGDPVPADLSLTGARHYWERNEEGTWNSFSEDVHTAQLETGKDGKTTFKFKAEKQGEYEFTLTGTDARGNKVDVTHSVYVYDTRGDWYDTSEDESIAIMPDKMAYKAGETARLIITTNHENATLLLTVEGRKMHKYDVVKLDGTTYLYEIKLDGDYSPNVFVDASMVSDNEFYMSEQEIMIPPEKKFLDVSIATDKETYKPGEEAQILVKVKDADGKPVDAELSVGVVDEAIYAVSREIAPDIKKFFYSKIYNRVQTDFSYGFYSSGQSESPDKLQASGRRRLGVADFKARDKIRTRRNFRDTMHWAPTVRTGADGEAVVTTRCPDNLTTWRVTVRAADAVTRVGQNLFYFKVRKNLLLTIGAPRFLREKDNVVVSTTVHNYLKEEKIVRVSLEAGGVSVQPAQERDITIPARGVVSLDWRADVPPMAGDVVFTAYARSDGESDAVEFALPFHPYGMHNSETLSLEIGANKSSGALDMNFAKNVAMETAGVRVEIAPTLAAGIFSSLDYLISYPYGCTEQTMSSFMPNAIVARTLKGRDVLEGERFKDLPDMMKKGLARLYDYQHGDGGWGWWHDDETNPFMTAYVVYGLSLARAADYELSESVYQEGVDALRKLLERDGIEPTTRAYMIYSLAMAGDRETKFALDLFEKRNGAETLLNPYARALLAMAMQKLGLNTQAGRLADDILSEASADAGLVYWRGKHWHYNWQDDSFETTAQCVRALLAVRPKSKEIGKAVRWLLRNRGGGDHWNSTRDTAIIVLALLDYTTATGELDAKKVTATLTVNGGKKQTRTFSQKDAFAEPWVVTLSPGELKRDNALRVGKSGGGVLYVTATRNWFSPDTARVERGFTVSRTYHRLTPLRSGDEWVFEKSPIGNAFINPGDQILVTVTIQSTADREYFMLEDFIPSGCEVLHDTSGYTITNDGFAGFNYDDPWMGWFRNMEIRDNRVVFFSSYFHAGAQTLQYIMRAELPGTYHAMPAQAKLMYFPDIAGNSAENVLHVTGGE